MTTLAEARDAVALVINTAWLAASVSSSIPMHWDDVKADKPGEDAITSRAPSYAKTTVRTIGSPQTTQGRRRFETTGTVTVQIFTPFGDGNTLGDALAQVILNALRSHVGSPAGLSFFDIDPNEIGETGPWFQTNVVASIRYQELAP